MIRTRQFYVNAILFLLALPLALGIPLHAQAQSSSDRVPENASARSYGNGWSCNPGYRESNGECEAIAVPFMSADRIEIRILWQLYRGA